MVLFIQRLQSLVTFKGAALVKANVATSLRSSALKWYTSELSDFDWDALNNDSGVKSWISTLSNRFKVPTNVTLGLLTDEIYSLDDARTRRSPAQYVRAIMRHGIGCNIVDVSNQLSFAYRGIAPELRVFVSPPTEVTKASNFICALEEKQEVWYKMMIMPMLSNRHYESFRRPSPFRSSPSRPSFPSQSKAFFCHQTQQSIRSSPQQPWRASERPLDVAPNGSRCQYSSQPFKQIFMPQRQ